MRTTTGAEVPLRAKSFALLRLLIENAGRLMTREAIMAALWPEVFVTDDNVTQTVLDVRRALGQESRQLLRTIRRRGYIFDAAAVRRDPAPATPGAGFNGYASPGNALSLEREPLARSGYAGKAVWSPPSAGRPIRPSVLILPLRSLDGSEARQRVAEMITSDIVTDVATQLRVQAPEDAVVLYHDDRLAHWRTVPADCEADYVLRGSVRGSRRPELNLQLMNATSGVCIWADRCEPYGRRDETAGWVRGIANALVLDVGRRVDALTTDLTASDLVMRGRAWMLRPGSASSLRRALDCFERAIAMEPDSVGARLGIVAVLATSLSIGVSHDVGRDEARMETLLLDVFDAGTDLAAAHLLNGLLRRMQGRLDESRFELETALDEAPHYAMAASQLGMTLLFHGQPGAALPYFERSVRMAPRDPMAPLLLSNLGTCLLLLGDTDAANPGFAPRRRRCQAIPRRPWFWPRSRGLGRRRRNRAGHCYGLSRFVPLGEPCRRYATG